MNQLKLIGTVMFLCSLAACGKVDVGMTTDQSKEKSITASEGVEIVSKINIDDKMDLSQSLPLGVIQAQAWQNFLRYATGSTNVLQLPMKLEMASVRSSNNSKTIMFEKLRINPFKSGKINEEFFAGARREPFLPWQEMVTKDLMSARADLLAWMKEGSQGSYPATVALWQNRYNAVLNILLSFQTGGNYYTAHEKTELWDGVVATEYSNQVLKDVLRKAASRKNKDFMRLRENLILQFLSIKNDDFESYKKQVSEFMDTIDKGQAVVLNIDKGIQVGSAVYLNEAGKTTTWQKIDGGNVIYSSNVVNGVEYKLVVSATKGVSTDLSNDMKRASDFKESVGNKTNIGTSLSSPQGGTE